MGNNPNSTNPLGLETRPYQALEVPAWNPTLAAAQRIRPGATTITNVHLLLPTVRNAPGLAIELVDTLAPAQTITRYYPGSDTGDTTTNWLDNAGGALNFGDINNPFQTATYGRNNGILNLFQKAQAYFRGNNAGALAGRRILRVRVGASIENRLTVGTSFSLNWPIVPVQGQVVMGGNTYLGNWRFVWKADAFQEIADLGEWYLSPATGLPWTVTEVDNIISAANADTFGINQYGRLDDQGLRCTATWIEVTHCLDNRHGFYYARGSVRSGWDRYTLSSTSAELANTEYWLVVSALTGSLQNFFTLDFDNPTPTSAIQIPSIGASASPSDNTKDHRQDAALILTGPGGIAKDSNSIYPTNYVMASLLEAAGPTILGESWPYGPINLKDRYSGAPANVGEQISTPGTVPAAYAAVQFTVGWQNVRPDRPLTIEVRHGAAAINGGGTLDATATFHGGRDMPDGSPRDYQVNFDQSFVPTINTQYTVLFSSTVANGKGYRLSQLDTRSDLLTAGTGTTAANVEGASIGGQTDGYVEAGAQNTRYDLGVVLIAAPAAPTGLSAVAVAAQPSGGAGVPTSYPPHVLVTWNATGLGTSFQQYNVYRRRRSMPAQPWTLVCSMGVPAVGPTASQVEANWREFRDYEAAWSQPGSFAQDGWDYSVTVINLSTGLESLVGSAAVYGVQPPAPADDWMVCNGAPWLNWPLRTQRGAVSDVLSQPQVYPNVAGRDFSMVRVPGTIPGRRYKLSWSFFSPPDATGRPADEWPELRGPRTAAKLGRQVAVMRARGDRAFGLLTEPATNQTGNATVATSDLFVTAGESPIVGANFPAGLVLDGASQYVTTQNYGTLNPGQIFTVFVCSIFTTSASGAHLTKGNPNVELGWQITDGTTPDMIRFRVNDGANQAADATVKGWEATGTFHVVAISTDGTQQTFYYDGIPVGTGNLAHGSLANTRRFVNGARDAAGVIGSFTPDTVQSWGLYQRVLTADEVTSLSRYLLGHALTGAFRPPPGAGAFYDLRDKRCHDGAGASIYDLSGSGTPAGTMVGSPAPRGYPWDLALLDQVH